MIDRLSAADVDPALRLRYGEAKGTATLGGRPRPCRQTGLWSVGRRTLPRPGRSS